MDAWDGGLLLTLKGRTKMIGGAWMRSAIA